MTVFTIALIFIMILLFSWQSLFSRIQANNYPGSEADAPIAFSVWYGLLIAVLTFLGSGLKFQPTLPTVILGVLNALIVLGYNICLLGASSRGNYSITIIFMIFGGILIPLFISVLFKGDVISPLQWAAILLMLVSFFLMNKPEKGAEKNKKGFLLLCVLLFVFNGVYGSVMSWQQDLLQNKESREMVMTTYFMLSLFSFLFLLLKSRGRLSLLKQTKKSALFLILAGLVGTGAQNLMLYLVGAGGVKEGILYTLDNGGAMLFSVLYSVVLFKEKLTKLQIFSLILALVALLSLCAV